MDPLELIAHAKNRHMAYDTQIGGESSEGAPGFAGGGEVIGKVTQLLKSLLGKTEQAAAPIAAHAEDSDRYLQLMRKYGSRQPLTPDEQKELTAHLANLPSEEKALGLPEKQLTRPQTNALIDPNSVAQSLRSTIIDPRHLDGLKGQDPSLDRLIQGYNTSVVNGNVTDDIRSALANKLQSMGQSQAPQPGGFAGGGEVQYGDSPLAREIAATPPTPPVIVEGGQDDGSSGSPGGHGKSSTSSLRWIADMARKLTGPRYGEDGARVATGIAKQFYGLDENGEPVLGGKAWLSSQHGTPPRILDELTSIPGGLVHLMEALNGPGPKDVPPANMHWSDDAATRLQALDKRVKEVTGVGDAHTLPEHIEDAAGMLATPIPAARVAKEAPMLQRALEYLAPVRPPTIGRYASDSAMLGGVSAGLDRLANRVTKHPEESVDPAFEDAAVNATNSGAQ